MALSLSLITTHVLVFGKKMEIKRRRVVLFFFFFAFFLVKFVIFLISGCILFMKYI